MMPALRSSNLNSADYDADTSTLTITFKGGSSYTYVGVDQATYEGLMSAPSPGKFFAASIKDAFTFTKA